MVKNGNGYNDVFNYIDNVLNDKETISGTDIKKACLLVKKVFETEDVYIDEQKYEAYLKLGIAMHGVIFDWERFAMALILCTFKRKDDTPRWSHFLVLMGRGNGKDGFIAWISLCAVSKYNKVKWYDVDICANNEKQSLRPVKDAVEFLNMAKYKEINKRSFKWTTVKVVGLENRGIITGHTNNASGKDGLRSGMVILNEIHQYQDRENVEVFLTGLGKKGNPISVYCTTQGKVRGGVLDEELSESELVLNGKEGFNDYFLPLIYRVENKEQLRYEKYYYMANPSLKYLPNLMAEIRKEKRLFENGVFPSFAIKRMNFIDGIDEVAVCDYKYIKATNKPLIDLTGTECIVGIDTAKTTDFVSVSAVFKKDEKYYVINHTWVCKNSKDLPRIKVKKEFPSWINKGIMTIVDDIEINPIYIKQYIEELRTKYRVSKVCIDDYRYTIYARELDSLGYNKANKNIKLVRPSDISKIIPIINSIFIHENFVWGDNPMLRWCANNTKVIPWKTKTTNENDVGAQLYAKIEAKSRKNDAFMSLVHAMTSESELKNFKPLPMKYLKARVYS